jgi:nitrogen regulatory protein P-II 1
VKVITVVLRPAAFDALKDALARFGVRGMTVAQVYLVTKAAPKRVEMYRGQRFASDFEPSLRVDLLAPDDEVADLVHVIDRVVGDDGGSAAYRWTTPVDWVVRVRTGEYGLDAL